MRSILNICAALVLTAMLAGAPAHAQSERLYDGITIEELKTLLSQITVDGQSVSITSHETPARAPYLAITSEQAGFTIFASGIGGGYNQLTGAMHGFQLFITVNPAQEISTQMASEFNINEPYVKLLVTPDGAILNAEHVVAGGVTELNISYKVGAFFASMEALVNALSNAGLVTVHYGDVSMVSFNGIDAARNDAGAPQETALKISNIRPLAAKADSAAFEARIHAAVDAAAAPR